MAAAISTSNSSATSSAKKSAATNRCWPRIPLSLPVIATNGVRYAQEKDREILDLFTAIRHHTTLDQAGRLLALNYATASAQRAARWTRSSAIFPRPSPTRAL